MIFFIRVDTLQHLLIIPNLFQFISLFFGQLVILDAIVNHLGVMTLCLIRNEITIFDSFVKGVLIVRFVFQFKKFECVFINLIPRSSSQANQQRIEILEYSSILTKYRTVCLVNNNEVEVPDAEFHIYFIDVVNHRLVGGENKSGFQVWHIIIRQ